MNGRPEDQGQQVELFDEAVSLIRRLLDGRLSVMMQARHDAHAFLVALGREVEP